MDAQAAATSLQPGIGAPLEHLRRGPAWWLRSYTLMLRFDLSSQRAWLPTAVALQILMGAGMAIIYGFYIPHLPRVAVLYLVTGAPALGPGPAWPGLRSNRNRTAANSRHLRLPVVAACPPRCRCRLDSHHHYPACHSRDRGHPAPGYVALWRRAVDLSNGGAGLPAHCPHGQLRRRRPGSPHRQSGGDQPDHEHPGLRCPAVFADRFSEVTVPDLAREHPRGFAPVPHGGCGPSQPHDRPGHRRGDIVLRPGCMDL